MPNPWFKRGTLFRAALDVLRDAGGPISTTEVVNRVLAAKGVTNATRQQLKSLRDGIHSSLYNHKGSLVQRVGHGTPSVWTIGRL